MALFACLSLTAAVAACAIKSGTTKQISRPMTPQSHVNQAKLDEKFHRSLMESPVRSVRELSIRLSPQHCRTLFQSDRNFNGNGIVL